MNHLGIEHYYGSSKYILAQKYQEEQQRRRKKTVTWIAAGALLLGLLLATGCQTKLDPAGPFKGDVALYEAKKTVNESYDILHDFVKFEYDNRALLARKPEIRKAADAVRANAGKWIDSAIAMVDAYETNRTDATRSAMQQSISILRTALTEVTKYMTENKVK